MRIKNITECFLKRTYFVVRQNVQNISSQSSHRWTQDSHEPLPQCAQGTTRTLYVLHELHVAIENCCEDGIEGTGAADEDRIIWFIVDSVFLLFDEAFRSVTIERVRVCVMRKITKNGWWFKLEMERERDWCNRTEYGHSRLISRLVYVIVASILSERISPLETESTIELSAITERMIHFSFWFLCVCNFLKNGSSQWWTNRVKGQI